MFQADYENPYTIEVKKNYLHQICCITVDIAVGHLK